MVCAGVAICVVSMNFKDVYHDVCVRPCAETTGLRVRNSMTVYSKNDISK